MILALKSGNIREIAKYSDICTAEIDYGKLVNQEKLPVEMRMRIRAIKEQKEKRKRKIRHQKWNRLFTS